MIGIDTEDPLVVVEYVGTTDHAKIIVFPFGFFGREDLGNDRGRGAFRPLFHSPKCSYDFRQLFHVNELLTTPAKRTEPRIPFGWLVERGILEPGTTLTDHRRRHTARVRADGTLVTADFRGSIHQVGAFVQKAPACNGWQFWHAEEKGKLVVIDVYRRKLRAELH